MFRVGSNRSASPALLRLYRGDDRLGGFLSPHHANGAEHAPGVLWGGSTAAANDADAALEKAASKDSEVLGVRHVDGPTLDDARQAGVGHHGHGSPAPDHLGAHGI